MTNACSYDLTRGGKLSSAPSFEVRALVTRVLESSREDTKVPSCFHRAHYIDITRLAAEVTSIVGRLQSSIRNTRKMMYFILMNVRASCARSQEEVAAKDEVILEANKRLVAKDQDLSKSNGHIT
ncbi:hypothetical protein V6N13_124046 [Hibiscus sabdariffa]